MSISCRMPPRDRAAPRPCRRTPCPPRARDNPPGPPSRLQARAAVRANRLPASEDGQGVRPREFAASPRRSVHKLVPGDRGRRRSWSTCRAGTSCAPRRRARPALRRQPAQGPREGLRHRQAVSAGEQSRRRSRWVGRFRRIKDRPARAKRDPGRCRFGVSPGRPLRSNHADRPASRFRPTPLRSRARTARQSRQCRSTLP